MTCHYHRRKKTNEKMLNVLTDRTETSPPEPGMNNLTTCKDNVVFNISFNANCSNGNTILPEMSKMQPQQKCKRAKRDYPSLLCRPLEAS